MYIPETPGGRRKCINTSGGAMDKSVVRVQMWAMVRGGDPAMHMHRPNGYSSTDGRKMLETGHTVGALCTEVHSCTAVHSSTQQHAAQHILVPMKNWFPYREAGGWAWRDHRNNHQVYRSVVQGYLARKSALTPLAVKHICSI